MEYLIIKEEEEKKGRRKKLIPSFTVLFAFASIFEQPIIQHMQFEPSNG